MKKRIVLAFTLLCLSCICLSAGCTGSTGRSDVTPTPAITTATPEPTVTPAEPATPAVETRLISIKVINLSSMDAGMFSIIDPVLNTQTDVNKLAANGTLSFDCNWPITVKDFNWALYDTKGELLLESTTDLTECENSLSILLSGEETIDDVDVLFD